MRSPRLAIVRETHCQMICHLVATPLENTAFVYDAATLAERAFEFALSELHRPQ